MLRYLTRTMPCGCPSCFVVRLRTIGIPNFIDLGPWDYTIVQNSACSGLLLFFLMPRCMFVRPGGVGPIELIWYIWGALSFQDFPKKNQLPRNKKSIFACSLLLSSRHGLLAFSSIFSGISWDFSRSTSTTTYDGRCPTLL